MVDYKKLNNDRNAINLSGAINAPRGKLTTGDITQGKVVTVTITDAATGQARVDARRTGAILLGHDNTSNVIAWSVTDGRLNLSTNGGVTSGTWSFWVF